MDEQRLYINEQLVELPPGEQIGLTIRANEIGAVGTIQSSLSNIFRIPRTRVNDSVLKKTFQLNNINTFPYTEHSARYEQNGVPLLQRGKAILEEATDENYELSVYGDNFDIIELTKGLNLSSIDFSSLDHIFNRTNVAAGVNNTYTDGYVWPLLDYGAAVGLSGFKLDGFAPCIYVRWIFEQIFSAYTLQGDLIDDSLFSNLIIDLKRLKTYYFKGLRTAEQTESTEIGTPPTYPFEDVVFRDPDDRVLNVDDNYQSEFVGTAPNPIALVFFFECPEAGEYEVEYSVDYEYNTNGSLPVNLSFGPSLTGASSDDVLSVPTNQRQTISGTITLTRAAAERIYFRFGTNADTFSDLTIYSSSLNIRHKQYPQGGQIDFAESVHDLSLSGIVETVFKMFGVVPSFDPITNILQLDYLENKIEIAGSGAKNWSDKIDFSRGVTIESRLQGYGQINRFEYTEDEAGAEQFNGQLDITDATIDKEVDFASLPFAASLSRYILNDNFYVPFIDKYELNDASPSRYEQTTEKQPRIMYLFNGSGSFDIEDADGNTSSISTFKQAAFVNPEKTQNLGFAGDANLLDAYYPNLLSTILNRPRLVTAYFKLTQIDIHDLELPELVFIDATSGRIQVQGYFYINKIEDYVSGIPCKVELVRVGF